MKINLVAKPNDTSFSANVLIIGGGGGGGNGGGSIRGGGGGGAGGYLNSTLAAGIILAQASWCWSLTK